MSKVLAEYFGEVRPPISTRTDLEQSRTLQTQPIEIGSVDWVITNPPFRLAEELCCVPFR